SASASSDPAPLPNGASGAFPRCARSILQLAVGWSAVTRGVSRATPRGRSAPSETKMGSEDGASRLKTGIRGLDDVLMGGLPAHRLYLLQGEPGTGKTTAGMSFVLEGVRRGESCLYVSLSETLDELAAMARSHGWSLQGLALYDMMAAEAAVHPDEENTLYVPAEVELGERMRRLLEEVDRVNPRRIVIDSCSELRLLAQSQLRFRRQILALKDDLIRRGCTTILLESLVSPSDALLQSLVHGVISLEQVTPIYGTSRRRLRVQKLREVAFRGGYHDFSIERGGIAVFPRIAAGEHRSDGHRGAATSGVENLDELLGGGLDYGTSTLVLGAAGSGKSVVATLYATAAAARGEHVTMYCFDEGLRSLFDRSHALGMELGGLVERGLLRVRQIDPAELSPGEFADALRADVEQHGVRMIVIDTLNGYLRAMPNEESLMAQLHELLSYLREQGVVTILIGTQHGLVGPMTMPIDVSYLADIVILMRFFEAEGRVRKAIS